MHMIEVKLYGPFREDVGEKVVEVPIEGDGTVGSVLRRLLDDHPVLEEKLYEDGRLRHAINVMRNGRNVKLLDGEATPVEDGDRLSVMVSIEGGCGRPSPSTRH